MEETTTGAGDRRTFLAAGFAIAAWRCGAAQKNFSPAPVIRSTSTPRVEPRVEHVRVELAHHPKDLSGGATDR